MKQNLGGINDLTKTKFDINRINGTEKSTGESLSVFRGMIMTTLIDSFRQSVSDSITVRDVPSSDDHLSIDD